MQFEMTCHYMACWKVIPTNAAILRTNTINKSRLIADITINNVDMHHLDKLLTILNEKYFKLIVRIIGN